MRGEAAMGERTATGPGLDPADVPIEPLTPLGPVSPLDFVPVPVPRHEQDGPARPAETSAPASMAALRERRDGLRDRIVAGRPDGVARQHALGKLTARERIDALLDEDSFIELDMYRRHQAHGLRIEENRPHTDGVVTGSGTIHGRRVFVYAQDFTVFGGSLGAAHAAKIHKVMDLAISTGAPLIGLLDSGGARIQEGVVALSGYGGIFQRSVQASGVIPQISVVLGPCAGGAAYTVALADFAFMVRDIAQMYLTGPDVVAAVSGQRVSHAELGGADVHGGRSGLATFVYDDERSCLAEVRYLVSLLPANNMEFPPAEPPRDATADVRPRLAGIVPVEPNKPYDMRLVMAEILDDGDFMEVHQDWAQNVVCALGRLDGEVVGVVGNQPMVLAGVLDVTASQKAARFVRFCDAFNIPLVTLIDVPGFLPGVDQEHAGIIRHGAKLLYAYCEATVPRVHVIVRKAYGGAYIVMDSRTIGTDLSLAWPTNEIAVMGAEGAVNVIFRKELAASMDPARLRAELVAEYTEQLMHPHYAAERGLVDDVIDPVQTRAAVARGLAMLRNKRRPAPQRKHGNVPL
ncbi:acetyl-CoA carboxylase carboxyltransferase component [Sphaerisporangium krabiense]|uniref:Acetyl-CoA carboxylase carboxyltransferase component n=3 Tax=Sphaerisporangium krabiense TaxID=763782 RepID=A0A7W8ZAE3_9ACTN|nr:acyl-CoA carboxylase subunit beta [Sphaerisporangium krabiense]MBB5630260.1 acetyl-CoA carboxylase carboxyltransferase component [Sphaerisporangium krabiense]